MKRTTPAYEQLRELYADLDKRISQFSRSAGLACPEGCGTCCETFVPELTKSEAEYIADHLINLRDTLTADSWTKGEIPGGCPFYKLQGNPYHCGIYEVRPLICRLFAYAGNRNKAGELCFRPCRHMPVAHPEAIRPTVSMEEFGRRLEAIDPGFRKEDIGPAVREAVARELLLRRMAAAEVLPDEETEISGAV